MDNDFVENYEVESKYTDLLIWQHKKPVAMATVDTIMKEVDKVFINSLDLGRQLCIDNAIKYSLDLVAKHVGTSRRVNFTKKDFFGFFGDPTALGFNDGQWYRMGEAFRDEFLLSDEDLRFLVRVRVLKNYQKTDIASIISYLQKLFDETANATDNLNMTIDLEIPKSRMTEFRKFAIEKLDILPRPMCVSYVFKYI